ncbi:HGL041Cp [Eremothecium sinecaudum]|uniref:UDP-N-acetylglucosamine transferase subunit ALG13 n=1 Tax=Eremothecium sinecaudum TaxID=45286 RepID=A0A0X8HVP9_9SACH|nr:HGL041Cp [Eremothecium sinecaudum]AMD22299.1 HGL041Cp [Eremothecium sinecaudum]
MSDREVKTVCVTSGATVPFPKLIDIIVSVETLSKLNLYGYSRLLLQYGRDYSEEYMKMLDNLGREQRIGCSIPDIDESECIVFDYEGLEVIGVEFHPRLDVIIKKYADLVISHAGTGSILDALRSGKRLIACVNDSLMDNHQEQIARKFEEARNLWAIYPKQKELLQALEKSEVETLKPLPPSYKKGFADLLTSMMYS